MRILFAGTPQFALPALRHLHEHSAHEVVAVLTNPDAHSGRGRKVKFSPVKAYALEQNIPVVQPPRLGREAREHVTRFQADLMAVVAYGKIFGPKFLGLFPRGAVNLHPSLLPLYRGPAPIPAAILAGDTRSGISIQEVSLDMDAGDIIIQEEFDIDENADSLSLSEYSSDRGAELLSRAIDQIAEGSDIRRPQDETAARYCSLLKKEDGLVDWGKSAEEIHRLVRAYIPWPLAHSSWEGRGLNIHQSRILSRETLEDMPGELRKAAESAEPGRVIGVDKSSGILVQTGDGVLALTRVQLHSKKAMDWKSFINGNPQFTSSLLGG